MTSNETTHVERNDNTGEPKQFDLPSPFAMTPIAGNDAFEDEDVFGDRGAAPVFTGLFGLIPDSSTAPLRMRDAADEQ